MTMDRSRSQAFVHGFTVVNIYRVQGKKKKIAGVVTLWSGHLYDSPGEGFLPLCPSHHALDDATGRAGCQ